MNVLVFALRVKIGYSCALRVAMRAPPEAHSLLSKTCRYDSIRIYLYAECWNHMMMIFTVIQVYLHYVYNILYNVYIPYAPNLQAASPPIWYCTKTRE